MPSVKCTEKSRGKAYLAVVDSEVNMVEGMVSRAVDDFFQWMSSNHVRIVNL
jgi:hypothetical protein